eukprot:2877120-Rhodomonas_salina.1
MALHCATSIPNCSLLSTNCTAHDLNAYGTVLGRSGSCCNITCHPEGGSKAYQGQCDCDCALGWTGTGPRLVLQNPVLAHGTPESTALVYQLTSTGSRGTPKSSRPLAVCPIRPAAWTRNFSPCSVDPQNSRP